MISLTFESHNSFETLAFVPFSADFMMSDGDDKSKKPPAPPSMGKDWGSGKGSGRNALFGSHDDFDIYCDREKGVNYIFHGPDLNCTIDHLEYDPEEKRITVFTNDRQRLDLGAKIQWLVRPYLSREQYLFIIQTKDGVPIEGVEVLLKIKEPDGGEKTLN